VRVVRMRDWEDDGGECMQEGPGVEQHSRACSSRLSRAFALLALESCLLYGRQLVCWRAGACARGCACLQKCLLNHVIWVRASRLGVTAPQKQLHCIALRQYQFRIRRQTLADYITW
jgi:hypothetical protein